MAHKKTFKSTSALLEGMGLSSTARAAMEQHIAEHSIAQKLTVYRAKAGLARKELAQKMGVSERTVAHIGTGRPEWGAEYGKQYFIITWEA